MPPLSVEKCIALGLENSAILLLGPVLVALGRCVAFAGDGHAQIVAGPVVGHLDHLLPPLGMGLLEPDLD